MSPDLKMLVWTAVLAFAQTMLAAFGAQSQIGLASLAGNRENLPPVTGWADRAARAHGNMMESLPDFRDSGAGRAQLFPDGQTRRPLLARNCFSGPGCFTRRFIRSGSRGCERRCGACRLSGWRSSLAAVAVTELSCATDVRKRLPRAAGVILVRILRVPLFGRPAKPIRARPDADPFGERSCHRQETAFRASPRSR